MRGIEGSGAFTLTVKRASIHSYLLYGLLYDLFSEYICQLPQTLGQGRPG